MSSLIQRGFEYGVIHQLTEGPVDLLTYLKNSPQIKNITAEEYIDMGCCYVNHIRVHENIQLQKGDYVRWHTKPRRYNVDRLDLQSRIVFENENIILLNKPAGIPCHPTVDNNKENIVTILSQNLGYEVLITHRLDLPTHGLLILAKNKAAQSFINQAFQERKIKKIYTAWTLPWPEACQKWTHYMQPSPRAPKILSSTPNPDWQECKLEITDQSTIQNNTTLAEFNISTWSELRIELFTGRTHQIRSQLSFENHPILGDIDYGGQNLSDKNQRLNIALWSSQISLPESNFFSPGKYEIPAQASDLF